MGTINKRLSGIVQGDIICFLRTESYSEDYIDFVLTAYSEKWTNFDAIVQYKLDNEWFNDIEIISSSVKAVNKNRLIGVYASKYGYQNTIRWKLNKKVVLSNYDISIRINIIPSFKTYTTSGTSYIVSEVHSGNKAELTSISYSNKPLGTNNLGQWIAYRSGTIKILNEIEGTPLAYRNGFSDPSHVYSMWNGNYIVADTGNNRIVELSSDLATVVKTLNIQNPVYVDYSESNETILVTLKSGGRIEEYTWGDSYGGKIWRSNLALSQPESATYNQVDMDLIAIADTGANRVVMLNRLMNQYSYLGGFKVYEDGQSANESLGFYRPFRVFWEDETIYVVEKGGKEVSFEILMSSSSSSSSSLDSSSSSESSSISLSSRSSASTSSSSTSLSSSSSSSIDSSSSSSSSSSSIDSSSSSSIDVYLEIVDSNDVEIEGYFTYRGIMLNGRKLFSHETNNDWEISFDGIDWVLYDPNDDWVAKWDGDEYPSGQPHDENQALYPLINWDDMAVYKQNK